MDFPRSRGHWAPQAAAGLQRPLEGETRVELALDFPRFRRHELALDTGRNYQPISAVYDVSDVSTHVSGDVLAHHKKRRGRDSNPRQTNQA